MLITRSFKDTVKLRAERDAAFRKALLAEAMDTLLAGEIDTGKAILGMLSRRRRINEAN